MVPEAAMSVQGSVFRIYLRSNFLDRPGERIRQRFSLAHEIAHTFFYQKIGDNWKVLPGTPRGDDLERACHEGAGRLLIPDAFLPSGLEVDRLTGEFVLELAHRAEVSVEVVLRRIRNHPGVVRADRAFVLARSGNIVYLTYAPWIQAILPKRAGRSIQDWLRNGRVKLSEWMREAGFVVEAMPDGSLIGIKEDATDALDGLHLVARNLPINSSSQLFELQRYSGLDVTEAKAVLVRKPMKSESYSNPYACVVD
jgi:hypothetical protein